MSDVIRIRCPQCQTSLKLKESAAGKRVACPKCQKKIAVPAPSEDEEDAFLNVSEPDADELPSYEGDSDADEFRATPAPASRRSTKTRGAKARSPGAGINWQVPVLAGGVLLLLGLLIGGGIWALPLLRDALSGNSLDLAWLPPEADLVFHARVNEVTGSPFFKSVSQRLGGAPLDSLLPLPAKDIRSVTVGATNFQDVVRARQQLMPGMLPGGGLAGMGQPATKPIQGQAILVFRLNESSTPEDLQSKLLGAKGETYGGYTLTRVGNRALPAAGMLCFFPDGSTIVMGTEADLKQAIDRGGRAARRKEFDFVDSRPQIVLAMAPKDPAVLAAGLGPGSSIASGDLEGCSFGVSLTEQIDVSVVAGCKSGAVATAYSGDVSKWAEKSRSDLAAFKATSPPAFAEPLQLGEGILRSLRVETSGSKVVVGAQIPSSVQSVLGKLPQLMMLMAVSGQEIGKFPQPANASLGGQMLPGQPGQLLLPGGADSLSQATTLNPAGQPAANPVSPERARGIQNLKRMGLGMHNFHDTHQTFPVAGSRDSSGKPLLSWRVALLPYIEHGDLYNQFHLNEPWDSEHNRTLLTRMPDIFRAPGSKSAPDRANYLAVVGTDCAIGSRIRDILDGSSTTVMLVEVPDELAVPWTKPDDYTYDPQNPLGKLVGLHEGGFLALMCDGSVHFLKASLSPEILRRLFQKSDKQAVPPEDLQ